LGFKDVKNIKITETLYDHKSYFDLRGPLKKEWRDGDSSWSLLSQEELNNALKNLEDQINLDSDKLRRTITSELEEIG